MRLLDHLNKHDRNVRGAILTTFPFSARFFESAFLPLLRQKSTGDANVVLVDESIYEATFDDKLEAQPTSAGKRYYLTPMRPQSGRTFHPKIYFFGGERTATAYVGSANLTQQAFTRNQEIMSVAHCTEAMFEDSDDEHPPYDAIGVITEVADFLAALFDSAVADRVGPVARESAKETLDAVEWVREAASDGEGNRSRWFLHNLEEPILGQVFDIIAAHDERVIAADIAAPFYGSTVDVPKELTDSGINTTAWLQDQQTQVDETALERWSDSNSALVKTYSHSRYVHGKVLVLQTTDATYVLGGSPNLSRAALLATATSGGEPGNVEAAMFRRVPDPATGVFETEPFTEATAGLDGFEAADIQAPKEQAEDTETDTSEAPSIRLLAADLVVYESYDGGELTVSADIPRHETIQSCTLLLDAGEETKRVLRIGTNDIGRRNDIPTARERLTIEKSLLTKSDLEPLRGGGKVRLEWRDDVRTNPCWLDVHTPSHSREAESAAEDRGAELVPMTLPELYLGDEHEQGEILSALNSFLEAMNQHWDDPPKVSEQAGGSSEEDSESDRGGLRMREWSASSNHDDPVSSYEAVYQEWLQDIEWLIHQFEQAPVDIIEEIGQVLKAINRSNVLILVLEDLNRARGNSVENLAVQSPRNVIKDIYTQRRINGELEGHLATLLELIRLHSEREPNQSDQLYDAIYDNIYPNTLLAAIVAHEHIADSSKEYYRQQDWAFEELVYHHFPDEESLIAEVTSPRLEAAGTAVMKLLKGIDEVINQSRRLKRYAAQEYLNETSAQQAIRSRLASTILYAGPDVVDQYRETFGRIRRVESELELNSEWLPSEIETQYSREI